MRANRRLVVSLLGAASLIALAACGGGQAAAKVEPTEPPAPTVVSPYQMRVTIRPQDARLGTDENVVIRVQMLSNQNRPVPGALMSAVVNYPSGPQTFRSQISTFPDGVVELAVPVAPATRGSNVRVEVTMTYQGQEYKAPPSGFTVR